MSTSAVLQRETRRPGARVPSVFSALLWKDASQIAAAATAVALILLIVQAILFVIMLNTDDFLFRQSMAQASVIAVLGAPILIGIACGGMLVGHERQSRTWHWNTTLPVDSKTALMSKLLVSIIAIVLTALVLCVIPLIAWFQIPDFGSNWHLDQYFSVYLIEVWSAALLSFFVSALIFREPITALFYGGAVAVLVQALVAFVPNLLSSFGIELNALMSELLRSGAMLLILVAGAILLVRLFRWRWTQGLDQSLSLWPRGANWASGDDVPAVVQVRRSHARPSEWWGHLQHSMRMSLGVRLGLIVASLLCLAVSWNSADELVAVVLWPVLPLLFGLTAFAGDHTQKRHGFLADRGAVAWKVAACRLAPPLTFACICASVVVFSLWSGLPRGYSSFHLLEPVVAIAVVTVGLALLGALASLSFSTSPVALVVSLLTLAAAATIYQPTQFLNSPYDPNPLWVMHYSVRLLATVCIPILLFAVFAWTKRWLVDYRAKLGSRYLCVAAVLVLVPFLLVVHTGFLFVPRLPWQGLTAGDSSSVVARLPERVDVELLPSRPESHELLLKAVSRNHGDFYSDIELVDYETLDAYRKQSDQAQQTAKASMLRLAETLRPVQESPTDVEQHAATGVRTLGYVSWVNETLVETAFAAGFYYQEGESELASEALKLHGDLHRLAAAKIAPATATGRATSLAVMNRMLTDEALRDLDAAKHLAKCTSELTPEMAKQYMHIAKAIASADRAYSAGRVKEAEAYLEDMPVPSRYWQTKKWAVAYPPLRWRYERAIALQLHNAIQIVKSRVSNTFNYPYALLPNWHDEMYQGKQHRDALRARLQRISFDERETVGESPVE